MSPRQNIILIYIYNILGTLTYDRQLMTKSHSLMGKTAPPSPKPNKIHRLIGSYFRPKYSWKWVDISNIHQNEEFFFPFSVSKRTFCSAAGQLSSFRVACVADWISSRNKLNSFQANHNWPATRHVIQPVSTERVYETDFFEALFFEAFPCRHWMPPLGWRLSLAKAFGYIEIRFVENRSKNLFACGTFKSESYYSSAQARGACHASSCGLLAREQPAP